MWNEDFLCNPKSKRIHHEQIHITRNVKGHSLDRIKMTAGENTYAPNGMKITRYGNYMDKYIRLNKNWIYLKRTDCLNKSNGNIKEL